MKNAFIVMIILILIAGGFFFLKNNSAPKDSFGNFENNGVQKLSLGMKNGNYYPNIIRVKEGVPVELTLDNSVGGCYRAFSIREFSVFKYSKNPADTIIFTPQKKGSFRFSCSMGMGYGEIVVE